MDYDRLRELQEKFEENPRRYFAPLANEYRKGGQPKRAIEICRAQLSQMPGHMSGQIVYGQALYEVGEFDEPHTPARAGEIRRPPDPDGPPPPAAAPAAPPAGLERHYPEEQPTVEAAPAAPSPYEDEIPLGAEGLHSAMSATPRGAESLRSL